MIKFLLGIWFISIPLGVLFSAVASLGDDINDSIFLISYWSTPFIALLGTIYEKYEHIFAYLMMLLTITYFISLFL